MDLPENQKALRGYDLTEANVKHTLAVTEKMRQAPEAKRREFHEAAGESKSFEDAAKKMEQNPEVSRMLKSEGISARDFLLTTITLSQASMISAMSKEHAGMGVPPSVNPKNLEFINAHPEIAQRWWESMQKMGRGHGGPPGAKHGDEDER